MTPKNLSVKEKLTYAAALVGASIFVLTIGALIVIEFDIFIDQEGSNDNQKEVPINIEEVEIEPIGLPENTLELTISGNNIRLPSGYFIESIRNLSEFNGLNCKQDICRFFYITDQQAEKVYVITGRIVDSNQNQLNEGITLSKQEIEMADGTMLNITYSEVLTEEGQPSGFVNYIGGCNEKESLCIYNNNIDLTDAETNQKEVSEFETFLVNLEIE